MMKSKQLIFALTYAMLCLVTTSCSDSESESPCWKQLYRINVGGKYGFINEKGDIIIEPQFDNAFFCFKDSVCFAQIGEKRGLINTEGQFTTELSNEIGWVYGFHKNKSICIGTNDKYGIIDKNGTIILPIIYNNIIRHDSIGFIVEDSNGNRGYVKNNGDFIVPCIFDDVNGYEDNLMVVATSRKCGYVDTMGHWVIDSIFDDARGFGNGLARVKKDGFWMFIDKKGESVKNLLFDEILTGFSDNRAFVKEGNSILLIDTNGKTKKIISADTVYTFKNGYATYKKGNFYGKIDTNGNEIIPPIYEGIGHFQNGFFSFERNGKYGWIDNNGKIVVEAVHNADIGIIDTMTLYGQDTINGVWSITYYNNTGEKIWRDMPREKFVWPNSPTKKDYIAYFDSKLSELDPIEGIYYVTINDLSENRENGHIVSNGSYSWFFAIVRSINNKDEFIMLFTDEDKPYLSFLKKFVRIGESNTYAFVDNPDVVPISGKSTNHNKDIGDGKLILEDPNNFEISFRTGGNNWYNFIAKCEFLKDYPSASLCEQLQQAEWTGSGFAISDGFIATNYHVINGAKTIRIRGVNGKMNEAYKGYVVASDREHDLAIIRIVDKEFKKFDAIPYCIGKSVPEVGDDVFVLGYPKTNTMGQEVKLTDGLISAASGFKGDKSMFQISAPVQPGNSGGPLFNSEGNVIGIVCAKHADTENANYAIKVSYLFNLVNSSGIEIKMPDKNNVTNKSLSKKVKQVKSFVYLIECRSH